MTNIHASTKNNYSIEIPCFSEINDSNPIKLYIYRFHSYFDGLIGCDLLEQWQAKIDLSSRVLVTHFAKNKIHMFESGSVNLIEAIIPAQSSKIIKVPTTVTNGEIIIDGQTICACSIGDCLTTSNNNQAYVEVSNPSKNDVIFALSQPISANIFNEQSVSVYDNNKNLERTQQILSRLRTDHLNKEESANLIALCKKYADVFYVENEPLTFTNHIKHRIKTTDEFPVHSKTYKYPHVHRNEVRTQIKNMLDQGIIRPSTSAWSAPIWIVPKKADASGKVKWRLVVDFRQLNEKTIDDKYPIPNINDILDKLGKCQYFSTLDLASGFYQVETHPNDRHKTAFSVDFAPGHFEFLRMPMGLKNAPSTFQRVMDNVLQGLQNEICVVYLDDILVFSTSLQEHIVNLRKVLDRLRQSNFKIQLDKSEFLKHETPYLGHIITSDGVKPNPDKISAISKYPIPRTTKQIKGFLGLLGYYRRFIPNFARLTKPLTSCLKKGAKITLSEEYIECFNHCKTLLTNDPILQYPDFTKDFNLTTDASNFALGAVLSQGPIGSDRPVAYASRTLNDSELNYSTIEKELLAIVWATKYFRAYLYGRKFKIITDHKPLQWLMNLKESNCRLTRWKLKLAEYDFTVIYKKGILNTNADALSRVEIHNEDLNSINVNISSSSSSTVTAPDDRPFISQSSTSTAPDIEPLRSPSSTLTANSHFSITDEVIPANDVETVRPHSETVHTSNENPVLEIPIVNDPLNKYHKQLILNICEHPSNRKPKMTTPFNSYEKIVIDISVNNFQQDLINTVKKLVDPKIQTAILVNPPEKMLTIVPILQKFFKSPAMKLVLVKHELENVSNYFEQQNIIRKYHEGKTNHRGITETYLSLYHRYFWPKLKETVSKFINSCTTCSRAKYDRNPIRPEFKIVPPPSKPFEMVHADILTINQERYLTVIDAFSKYAQVYQISDCTAPNIVKAFLTLCTHHGFPINLTTDRGTEFTNQVFREFLLLHNVYHHTTAPYAHNENGMIERLHSTILEHLRLLKLQFKNESTSTLMKYALIAYNSSVHSLTKSRPFDLISGHFDPRDPTDLNLNERLMQQYIQDHRQKMELIYKIIHDISQTERNTLMSQQNAHREPQIDYEEGQEVYIRNPLAARQKIAPRFQRDRIISNLPVHIYTSKKRTPVAKNRLKRKRKTSGLLQMPDDPDKPGPSTRHPA